MYTRNTFFIVAAVLLLVACAGTALQKAKKIEPTGTEFQKTLHQEYLQQAETEQQKGNVHDVDFYSQRAITAGSGMRVEPYQVNENGLPTETVPVFRKAKGRLNNALGNGARQKTPYRAARAQAAYDCWWEEVVDNNGLTQRATVCRDRFRANMDEIEEILNRDKQPAQ